jgi:hypothetical protein
MPIPAITSGWRSNATKNIEMTKKVKKEALHSERYFLQIANTFWRSLP